MCAIFLVDEHTEYEQETTGNQVGEQFARGSVPVVSIPTLNASSGGNGSKCLAVLVGGVSNGGGSGIDIGITAFWVMTILNGSVKISHITVSHDGSGTSAGSCWSLTRIAHTACSGVGSEAMVLSAYGLVTVCDFGTASWGGGWASWGEGCIGGTCCGFDHHISRFTSLASI